MLRGLDISDMLIIDRLELAFQPGLNVLTGETGAGKSILLDSLGFVLGWRGRADLVRQGAAQGEVTDELGAIGQAPLRAEQDAAGDKADGRKMRDIQHFGTGHRFGGKDQAGSGGPGIQRDRNPCFGQPFRVQRHLGAGNGHGAVLPTTIEAKSKCHLCGRKIQCIALVSLAGRPEPPRNGGETGACSQAHKGQKDLSS